MNIAKQKYIMSKKITKTDFDKEPKMADLPAPSARIHSNKQKTFLITCFTVKILRLVVNIIVCVVVSLYISTLLLSHCSHLISEVDESSAQLN